MRDLFFYFFLPPGIQLVYCFFGKSSFRIPRKGVAEDGSSDGRLCVRLNSWLQRGGTAWIPLATWKKKPGFRIEVIPLLPSLNRVRDSDPGQTFMISNRFESISRLVREPHDVYLPNQVFSGSMPYARLQKAANFS